MEEREIRYVTVRELRAEDGKGEGEKAKISGYAAVFDVLSEDLGGFREKIQAGAFSRSLQDGDQKALWNHNTNYVLGRKRAGTLELVEDEVGLRFVIYPPNTSAGRDALEVIKRGDVDQMSFAFRVPGADGEGWEQVGNQIIRTLREVELFEVSPVAFPAYPQTSVYARSLVENMAGQVPVPVGAESHEQVQVRVKAKNRARNRKLELMKLD